MITSRYRSMMALKKQYLKNISFHCLIFPVLILTIFYAVSTGDCQEKSSRTKSDIQLVLTQAVMCEHIKGFGPANPAVTFPISFGKIYCFTSFKDISHNTFIYHKWFHKDRFVATNRFRVKAPRWSTFSIMQLRVADKGPWRVEITDDNGNLLKTLRFSVSD